MNSMDLLCASARTPDWASVFVAHQFSKASQGFEHHGLHCAIQPRWLEFSMSVDVFATKPSPGSLGWPGLWTRTQGLNTGPLIFDLPMMAVTDVDPGEWPDGEEDASFAAHLRWVMASARGGLPENWRAPSRACLDAWIPAGALTVQLGPLVRQGDLVLGDGRWALRFPVLPALPRTLPPVREQALLDLMADAGARWRMVRLGMEMTGEQTRALIGEVDLSGAPHSQSLFLASLDALKQVVLWLAETADLLADVTVTLQALEQRRPHNLNERTEP